MASFSLYDGNYMRLMALPAVLIVVFLAIVTVFPGMTLGLDFVGGTRLIVNTDKLEASHVEDILTKTIGLPDASVSIVSSPLGSSARIEYAEPRHLSDARIALEKAAELTEKNPEGARVELQKVFSNLNGTYDASKDVDALVREASQLVNTESENLVARVQAELIREFELPADTAFNVEQVTPTFGASFLANTIGVAIVSIALLIIVIFVFFREVIPSLAVVEAALFDMLTALALLTVFGFSITLSVVAGLLMMVGYSVDTDILLTTRVLKRKDKSVIERSNDTLITGLTITATLMVATLVMLIVSYFAQITVIFEISATILFGLIGDIIATWFTNAPILLWYWERKHGKIGGK